MKSNFIRYLLGGLITAVCVATAGNTQAYVMWDLVDDFNSCSSCVHTTDFRTNDGLALQYYNITEGYFSNSSSSSVSLDYMAAVRTSRLIWSQPNVGYVSYPLVGFADNGAGGIDFKYFLNGDTPTLENFSVASRAGFTHTFSDGYSCLMDKVFFNAGSFIFMCSDSYRTYQVLAGGYTLGNHILYLDPYNSTNNVWWIAWAENKARSTTLIKEDMSKILYGDMEINQSLLESIFSTGYYSYSVSAGGSNIWPTCGLRTCNTQGLSNGFIYNRDLTTVTPDFGGGTNVDSNTGTGVILSGSISQKKTLEEYNSCIDRYINVKDLSSFWFQCRNDYENNKLTREQYLAIENYVLDLDSNTAFSGSTVTDNCFLMSDIALNMYDTHSGTYNTDVNLAWRGSSSTAGIDLSYMCGSKPSVTPSDDGVNWWQDLLNRIGLGSSITSGGSSVFDTTITSFKDMISDPFNEYIIDPIQSEYNSGYAKASPVACVTTNNSFDYGDYILYFGAVILVLVLYGFFF